MSGGNTSCSVSTVLADGKYNGKPISVASLMDKLTSSTVFPGEQFVVEGDVGLQAGSNTFPKKSLPRDRNNTVRIRMDKKKTDFLGIEPMNHYFCLSEIIA